MQKGHLSSEHLWQRVPFSKDHQTRRITSVVKHALTFRKGCCMNPTSLTYPMSAVRCPFRNRSLVHVHHREYPFCDVLSPASEEPWDCCWGAVISATRHAFEHRDEVWRYKWVMRVAERDILQWIFTTQCPFLSNIHYPLTRCSNTYASKSTHNSCLTSNAIM